MNLRYLQYLRLVIDHGSFAAAARASGVSQPAISHGMLRLQQTLDTPLFIRSGRRMLPTDAALRLAHKGRSIAESVEALADAAQTGARPNVLRVGVTPSAALVCGVALHQVWCHAHPNRRLNMSSADEARMLSLLQTGELDLVIAPMPRGYSAADLATQVLYQITPLVYARRTHPLVKVQSLGQLDQARWAIVGPSVGGSVNVLKEALAVRQMPPACVAASCPDYASLLNLLAHTDLLGVLPHVALLDSAPKGQLVSLRLREALPRYEMHLFSPKRLQRRLGPTIAALQRELAHFTTDDGGLA